jgi:hypothetical protein
MLRSSWVAAQLTASLEGLSFMNDDELFQYFSQLASISNGYKLAIFGWATNLIVKH